MVLRTLAMKSVKNNLGLLSSLLLMCGLQTADAQNSSTSEKTRSNEAAAPSENDLLTGFTTVFARQSRLSVAEPGIVESVSVQAGEATPQGTAIIKLDHDQQRLAVDTAELDARKAADARDNRRPLEIARAQLLEAEQMLVQLTRTADASLRQSESTVAIDIARKSRDAAEVELERAKGSRSTFPGSVSQSELTRLDLIFQQRVLEEQKAAEDQQLARLKYEVDHAAVESQRITVNRMQLLAEQQEHELKVRESEYEAAAKALELARIRLNRRILAAPYPGVILSVSRQPGEWVEPGAEVCTLAQMDVLRIEGFVASNRLSSSHVGQQVTITFPENSELPEVTGKITFVSPSVDPVNQQVRVWAEFPNPQLVVRPGVSAAIRVPRTSKLSLSRRVSRIR